MRKQLLLVIGLWCAFAFSSCSSMYIPSMVNTPLLSEQGEIQGELSLTTNAVQLGVDYAITDHLAAMAQTNISYGNFTNAYDIYTSKDEDSTYSTSQIGENSITAIMNLALGITTCSTKTISKWKHLEVWASATPTMKTTTTLTCLKNTTQNIR